MKRSVFSVRSSFPLAALWVAAALALGGCGASTSSGGPTWNITGSWLAYHETTGTLEENGPEVFQFSTSDTTVGGTSPQGQSLKGKVEALDVSFSWVDGNSVKHSYSGTVSSDGATMSGTWTASDGTSGSWHAITDVSATIAVAGNWSLYRTATGTTGEQGPSLVSLTQAGNIIGGAAPDGQSLVGAASGTILVFSCFGNGISTAVYTGTTTSNGSTLSGTWVDTSGNSGAWRAVRS